MRHADLHSSSDRGGMKEREREREAEKWPAAAATSMEPLYLTPLEGHHGKEGNRSDGDGDNDDFHFVFRAVDSALNDL